MLLGILIGVYFTLNAVITFYFAFGDWEEPVRWYYWIIMTTIGVVVYVALSILHALELLNKWVYSNNWYYQWLTDTLLYEKNLGIINRAGKRKLRFVQLADLQGNWPRRKLSERIDERLKEMEQ